MPKNLNYGQFGQFKWPIKGDKILDSTGPDNYLAEIESLPDSRGLLICNGYRQSAEILVNRATILTWYDRKHFVYPILFLYRHSLELDLKYLLEEYGPYADMKPNRESHDLRYLWNEVRHLLEHARDNDSDAIKGVENVIVQFSQIDPNSSSFRYSQDRDGNPLQIDFAEINLVNLRDVMEGLANFFDGADGVLDAWADGVREMRLEFAQEMNDY